MLEPTLDTKIDTDTPDMANTRDGFGEGLRNAGSEHKEVVALCADLTESTRMNLFAEAYPERFIQMGVAEQNMASVASGLAAMGKVPFISSYAMFSPGRNWEQIRTTIAYNQSNVKIIGAHAGISVGPDGATHQAIEDIALMRVVPGMVVLAPVDIHEARRMTEWAAEYEGPVYMRIGREKTPVVTTPETTFSLGKALTVIAPSEASVAILSTGTMLFACYQAAAQLAAEGIVASVTHFGSIKPLDTEALDAIAASHNLIITVEEHQIAGGFGSAVTEYVSAANPRKIIRVGVDDVFGQSGETAELLHHYGIDTEAIVDKVIKNLV